MDKMKVIGAAFKPSEIETLKRVKEAGNFYSYSAALREGVRLLAAKVLRKGAK